MGAKIGLILTTHLFPNTIKVMSNKAVRVEVGKRIDESAGVPPISCTNCEAACCQGGTIELTLEEASFMIRGGNRLRTIAQPVDYDREEVFCPAICRPDPGNPNQIRMLGTNQPLAAGLGRYFMIGACAYLQPVEEGWQACSAYDQRPGTCKRFEVGESQCRILRETQGIDPMSEETQALVDVIEASFT